MTDQLMFALEARGKGHRVMLPTARHSDPPTAHHAAAEVTPGNDALIGAIRAYLAAHGPSTAWQIAAAVAGDRWDEATVRTACAPKRSGCVELDGGVKVSRSGRERAVKLYALNENGAVPGMQEQNQALNGN